MVLEDHRAMDVWLDKGQVEYLLSLGGYQFKAKNPTNSVEVTLRRLASGANPKCEVEKGAGPHGNRYRASRKKENGDEIEALLSRATKK